jgi:hypothetical protein
LLLAAAIWTSLIHYLDLAVAEASRRGYSLRMRHRLLVSVLKYTL